MGLKQERTNASLSRVRSMYLARQSPTLLSDVGALRGKTTTLHAWTRSSVFAQEDPKLRKTIDGLSRASPVITVSPPSHVIPNTVVASHRASYFFAHTRSTRLTIR